MCVCVRERERERERNEVIKPEEYTEIKREGERGEKGRVGG